MTAEQAREAGKAARRAYYREWARKNKDKIKVNQENYWIRRAKREAAADQQEGSGGLDS